MLHNSGNLYRGDPRPDLRDRRRGFCRLAGTEPSRHIRRARQQAYGRALDERTARLGRLTAAPGLDYALSHLPATELMTHERLGRPHA